MLSVQHRNSTAINGDNKYNQRTDDYHNLITSLIPVWTVKVYQLKGGNVKTDWNKPAESSSYVCVPCG